MSFICTFLFKWSNSSIWSIDRTLSIATTPGHSRPGSDGNEGVDLIPQIYSITGASSSDCLISYTGHSLGVGSYPFYKNAVWESKESVLLIYFDCPVSWGCKIHWLHLSRGVRPLTQISVLDMTLTNLMVRFQWCWSFGECGVLLHSHC